MSNLCVRTRKINAVLMFGDSDLVLVKEKSELLRLWCSSCCETYAYIIHDLDCLEDGTPKKIHIHLVADLNRATRLSTVINSLADGVQCSPLAISIEKYSSLAGSLQYLVHKNDVDKYQYSLDGVVTNIEREELETLMNSDTSGFDYERWLSIVEDSPNIVRVIGRIGLNYYNMYRNTIQDMFKCVHDSGLYAQTNEFYYIKSKCKELLQAVGDVIDGDFSVDDLYMVLQRYSTLYELLGVPCPSEF